jgi:hypothetical protein
MQPTDVRDPCHFHIGNSQSVGVNVRLEVLLVGLTAPDTIGGLKAHF